VEEMADLHIVVTSGDGRRWEGNIPEVLVGPPVYEYS
jgi:hypothetical protein